MSVIIRLQNLPWTASTVDIRRFFYGLNIPDGGVHIIGGTKGDAFIAFATDEDARQAMMKDGGKINENVIKLMLSSKTEMQNVISATRSTSLPVSSAIINESFQKPTQPVSPFFDARKADAVGSALMPDVFAEQFNRGRADGFRTHDVDSIRPGLEISSYGSGSRVVSVSRDRNYLEKAAGKPVTVASFSDAGRTFPHADHRLQADTERLHRIVDPYSEQSRNAELNRDQVPAFYGSGGRQDNLFHYERSVSSERAHVNRAELSSHHLEHLGSLHAARDFDRRRNGQENEQIYVDRPPEPIPQDSGKFYDDDAEAYVVINNLPSSYKYKKIRQLLKPCDLPHDGIKIVLDSRDRHVAAYVTLRSARELQHALKVDGQIVHGRRISVSECSKLTFMRVEDSYFEKPHGNRRHSRSPVRGAEKYAVVKGLPADVTERDIRLLFHGIAIAPNGGPFFVKHDRNQSIYAVIEFNTPRDFEAALKFHKKIFAARIIKVIGISAQEFQSHIEKRMAIESPDPRTLYNEENLVSDKREWKCEKRELDTDRRMVNRSSDIQYFCVQLDNLPETASIEMLQGLFKGLKIVERGIHAMHDSVGRVVGKVFIEFENTNECQMALQREKQFLGNSKIHIKPIGKSEMLSYIQNVSGRQPEPAKSPPATVQHPNWMSTESRQRSQNVLVSLKNLHFNTKLEDILDFFHGYRPIRESIKLQYRDGRPTGDGIISFYSIDDAEKALHSLHGHYLLGQPLYMSFL